MISGKHLIIFASTLICCFLFVINQQAIGQQNSGNQTSATSTSQNNNGQIKLPEAGSETKKLGALVGEWVGGGEIKAGDKTLKVSGDIICQWAPNGYFLVCDQAVDTPDGRGNSITVYSYNSKTKDYTFYGLDGDDAPARKGRMTIDGNHWTYFGEFQQGDKHIQVRTINEITADTLSYRTEFSEDGTHWTVTGSGSSHKIK